MCKALNVLDLALDVLQLGGRISKVAHLLLAQFGQLDEIDLLHWRGTRWLVDRLAQSTGVEIAGALLMAR